VTDVAPPPPGEAPVAPTPDGVERVFSRLPSRDDRNRLHLYGAAPSDAGTDVASRTWTLTRHLDQGSQPACVGYSWCHELAATPNPHNVWASDPLWVYQQAKLVDEWPGTNYDGTSVLAGAKILQWLGHFAAYRWAYDTTAMAQALTYEGPGVLGCTWRSGMMSPNAQGFISPTGGVYGGHAVLVVGQVIARDAAAGCAVDPSASHFVIHNSWGSTWGQSGRAKITFADMATLLADDGEFCVPERRKSFG
jgi:hypothetical protein